MASFSLQTQSYIVNKYYTGEQVKSEKMKFIDVVIQVNKLINFKLNFNFWKEKGTYIQWKNLKDI